MMKKWMACLLAVLLMLTVALSAGAQALASTIIDPMFLRMHKRSINSWCMTASSRAELATCTILDLAAHGDDRFSDVAYEAIGNNTIYVAQIDAGSVFILFWGDTELMLALYSTELNAIIATLDPVPSGDPARIMERLRTGGNVRSYYLVTGDEIVQAMNSMY